MMLNIVRNIFFVFSGKRFANKFIYTQRNDQGVFGENSGINFLIYPYIYHICCGYSLEASQ